MEHNDNFRALAENANDGILVATVGGDHVYANKRAAEITGYSVQEILKTKMRHLAHPDEVKKIQERLKQRLEGKPVPHCYKTAVMRKDGKRIPVEMTGATLVKEGRTTKEIAALLNISTKAIEFYRQGLRRKLGLKSRKANLRSHLMSIRRP